MRILFFILFFLPYFFNSAFAANIDAKLMVISDLHHSQIRQTVSSGLVPTINNTKAIDGSVTNWLGLGDIIDSNFLESGPFSANNSDLLAAINAAGITFKSIKGNHDIAGGDASGVLFPGDVFSWDIGNKWRVLGIRSCDEPGDSITQANLTWLSGQLEAAEEDGRYVVVATHHQLGTTRVSATTSITPAATTGLVTVTTNPGDFVTSNIGRVLYIKQGDCVDESCWGWGQITSCDGGSACTTGTSITVNVWDAFVNTSASSDWGLMDFSYMAINSAAVRAILESSTSVKLALNGHLHQNGKITVNGIDYVDVSSCDPIGGLYGKVNTGGILHLYDDGSWKLRGTGTQTSYNWESFFVDVARGSDTENGGTSVLDPLKTLSKGLSVLAPGVNLKFLSDVSGDVSLNGSEGNRTVLSPSSERMKFNGNIYGSYIKIDSMDVDIPSILDADNSVFTKVRMTP